MKLKELQKALQTNFKVVKQGRNFQQTISQIKIEQAPVKNIASGELVLYQQGHDIVCQATDAALVIKKCADFTSVCNQANAALWTEIKLKNELLALNLKKYDLDQLLKMIGKKFKLEIIACDLNHSIIGSNAELFKNNEKRVKCHKQTVKICNEMVQMGTFAWHLAPDSNLFMTEEILQTLSQVLCHNLLTQQMVSVINSPAEVMLVRLLKSQQVADVEEYFLKQKHPLPDWLAFIYILGTTPDKIAQLKQLVQKRFTEYFGFAISSVYQGQLISLVKLPLPTFFQAETRSFLEQEAHQLHVQFLVANPVQNLTALRAAHQAALLLMKDHVLTKQVNFCADAALPLLVEQDFNLRMTNCVLNPVPQFLANYDQTHATHLLLVLKAYLINDCSIVQTAHHLYLHRNSVTNQLRKIERLTGINYHKFKQLHSLQLAVSVYQTLQNKN